MTCKQTVKSSVLTKCLLELYYICKKGQTEALGLHIIVLKLSMCDEMQNILSIATPDC